MQLKMVQQSIFKNDVLKSDVANSADATVFQVECFSFILKGLPTNQILDKVIGLKDRYNQNYGWFELYD